MHSVIALAALLLAACSTEKKQGSDEDTPTTISGVVEAAQNVRTVHTPYYSRINVKAGLFEEMTPPNIMRTLAAPHLVEKEIYLLGGFDNAANYSPAIERFDPVNGLWSSEPSRPDPGLAFDVVLGKKICGIGGIEDWKKPIRRKVDCFDTESKTWHDGTDVPLENAFFSVIPYKDYAYVFGGLDKDSREPLNSAWRYDAARDEWVELARMPFGFFAGGQAAHDGKIYLVGGYKKAVADESPDDAPKDTPMIVYDVATDSWSTLPDMPHARLLYGTGVINGRIAVFMGLSTEETPTIELFDPKTSTWKAGSEPDLPKGGSGFLTVQADNQVYFLVVGALDGSESKEHRGKLTVYDAEKDEWSLAGRRSTDYPYANFLGLADGDYLHFIGAHSTVNY